jgi:hypothetical protein
LQLASRRGLHWYKAIHSRNSNIAMALSDETKDRINAAIGVGKVSSPLHQ